MDERGDERQPREMGDYGITMQWLFSRTTWRHLEHLWPNSIVYGPLHRYVHEATSVNRDEGLDSGVAKQRFSFKAGG